MFPSAHEVQRILGIKHQCISAACLGKQKTAGKMHWDYISEEEYQEWK